MASWYMPAMLTRWLNSSGTGWATAVSTVPPHTSSHESSHIWGVLSRRNQAPKWQLCLCPGHVCYEGDNRLGVVIHIKKGFV